MTLRLYLDTDVSPLLARMLRDRGYDVVSAHEVGALRLSDEEQLERATSDDRVIVTFNYRDFISIASDWAGEGRVHSGIVVSYHQFSTREVGALARHVEALMAALAPEDMVNAIRALEDFIERNPDESSA